MTSGRPGAVHLGLPFDVQKGPVDGDEIWGDRALGEFLSLRVTPSHETVEAAAAAMAAAERPLLICGGGPAIAGARAAVTELAERTAAGGATPLTDKRALPPTHSTA